MTDTCIVLTTAGTNDEAQKIGRALVESTAAACVNIISPIESIYRWKGKVETGTEWLLVIKTTYAAFERVHNIIRELHSYELPECIMFRIEDGSPAYLDWINQNVR